MAFMIGFTASCSKETLEPTNMEKDWAKNIDLSNSYVKDLYEKTGVAILTDFNDTLDVYYQGADEGVLTMANITHLTPEKKDAAIKWFKENILDCFSTECIRNYFPRRIFLCDKLTVDDTPGSVGGWVEEVRYTNNLWGTTGVQHAYPFAQGLAVNISVDYLLNEETAVDYATAFRVDIMTIICDELFMKNNWLAGIENNTDLFPDDVTELYNRYIIDRTSKDKAGSDYVPDEELKLGAWTMWHGKTATDKNVGDPVTYCDKSKMSLEGFFQFGFPDHGHNYNIGYGQTNFHWPTGTPQTFTSNNNADKENRTYTTDGYVSFSTYTERIPDCIDRDARNLILALIDLQDPKLQVYGEFLIDRLYIMSEYLKGYGIDFQKFNPSVVKMYQMHEE